MMDDSLKVHQNEDGSFQSQNGIKKITKWSWLNGLTSKEIQVIIEKAIQEYEQ